MLNFPGCGAETVGRFLQHGRDSLEDSSRDGGYERQNHDRKYQASSENPDSERRSGEQVLQNWHAIGGSDDRGHDIMLQKRRENEQPPDSVDDAGNTREQF